MAVTKTSALGVVLEREVPGSPGTYAAVAALGDFTGPDFGHDFTETTSHDAATNGRRRTYVATLGKSAQIAAPMFFDSADAVHGNDASTGLLGDAMTGTLRNFRVTYQDTGNLKISFAAFVAQYEIQAPVEGVNTANLALQISGNFTFDGF